MEHTPPPSAEAVHILEQSRRRRESIGDWWLFPSREDSSRSASRRLVRDWWRRAEKLAEVPWTARLGWRSLRRKFVNDLKGDIPTADLCYPGRLEESLDGNDGLPTARQVTMKRR
jgi:hypothetical protein